jgi:biotin-(acetyl-CoA carboxylase) ligase
MEAEATCIDDNAGAKVPRRKILVGFLHHFQILHDSFEKGNHAELIETWKQHSTMHSGVKIWIEEGDRRRSALTCGLDDMGALVVQTEEGARETILAGSIRIQKPR